MDNLRNFIQEKILELTFKNVSDTDSLISSGILDSISLVELITHIEEEINKPVPQHLLQKENFETIELILDTIAKI